MKSLFAVAVLCWLTGLTSIVSDPSGPLYEAGVRSVVLIESEMKVTEIVIFADPSKVPEERERTITRTGTGFVLNGRLITCFHVVGGAESIFITEKNGRKQEAKVVKFDEEKDLAELEVKARPPSLYLAKCLKPQTRVWQIGNPGPMRFVMTSEGRYMGGDGKHSVFDLTTYFGFSGSPVLNRQGEVVGMSQALRGRLAFGATIENLRGFLK